MWTCGVSCVDAIWCRLWHSDFLFSSYTIASLWIMALVVVDHMLMIVRPTRPTGLAREAMPFYLLTIYTVGYVSCTPSLATVSIQDGKCVRNVTPPGASHMDSFHKMSKVAVLSGLIVPLLCLLIHVRRMQEMATTHTAGVENGGNIKSANWVATSTGVVFILIIIAIELIRITTQMQLYATVSLSKLILVTIWTKSLVATPLVVLTMSTMHSLDALPICHRQQDRIPAICSL